jgi:hypothetical protein
MKNKTLAILSVAGLLVLFLGLFNVGFAQEIRHGDNATIASNETVNGTAYLAGRNINAAGEVNGDLYCAGQNVNISGKVHGDIICAGQTINITATVDGDVRLAGQDVSINSSIANNATIAAQTFTLNSSGKIGQDITGGTDSMVINGTIGRDLVLGGNSASINGTIGRNIKSQIEKLSLGNSAKVGGSIDYTSSNQLVKAPGATIAGPIHHSQPKKHEHKNGWFGIGFRVYWFFAMLLVSLVLVLLFPSIFQKSTKRTMASFGRTLLLGIAAVLFTPIIFVLLMATIVGIPLGIILMLAWILGLILSGPFFAYLIGREVWRNQRNPIWTMLLGAVIILLVYNIPFIGGLVMLAALFIGMGMIVRELTTATPKPIYKQK